MRVLGRIRLSRLTDESTSAARQRHIIEQWADTHGHEVIGWAEDLDVSGSVDPFDTPALGAWLTPDKQQDWDLLCAWKLDRLGRDSIRLNKLFGWAIDNGKTIVSCSEGIDLSTPVGRLIANVIAFLAEGELEAIRERTKASRKALRQVGRWPGGPIPYGLQAAPLDGGGWTLVHNPDTLPILHRIVAQIVAGKPAPMVADELNAEGVPSPTGVKWPAKTIRKITTSKYLLGHTTYEGNTVRDREGKPVYGSEPLLSQSQWDELQRAVEERRAAPRRVRKTSPLLGVIVCWDCGANLYHQCHVKEKRDYRYYYCPGGHTAHINAVGVEETLAGEFLDAVGDCFVSERVYRQAENHQIELEDCVRAVDELSMLLGTITSTTMRSRLTEQMTALDSRITLLETIPTREAGYEYIQTGVTYRQQWEQADTEGKRQLLLKSGITYRTKRVPGTQAVQSAIFIPDEILDLLNTKKPHTQ
jgi:DNA invertase Pin-like site-specific DNA recombinase